MGNFGSYLHCLVVACPFDEGSFCSCTQREFVKTMYPKTHLQVTAEKPRPSRFRIGFKPALIARRLVLSRLCHSFWNDPISLRRKTSGTEPSRAEPWLTRLGSTFSNL